MYVHETIQPENIGAVKTLYGFFHEYNVLRTLKIRKRKKSRKKFCVF